MMLFICRFVFFAKKKKKKISGERCFLVIACIHRRIWIVRCIDSWWSGGRSKHNRSWVVIQAACNRRASCLWVDNRWQRWYNTWNRRGCIVMCVNRRQITGIAQSRRCGEPMHERYNCLFQRCSDRFTANGGLETVYIVSGVIDNTMQTVCIDKAVRSLHIVTIADFLLLFDVAGLGVVHRVWEIVLRRTVVIDGMRYDNGDQSQQSDELNGFERNMKLVENLE